ncbi:MAG: lysophospholipid acyltransferase family protein [Elusimicrobia bacterium]|nr:lysophospholipid acyltransferase family protein [Elusimicrobiota bacterium]
MAVELDWEEDARPLMYRTAGPFGRWLMMAVWRLKVSGLEHVPAHGAALIASNHVSFIDPPLVGWAALPARSLRYLAKMELFRIPLLGWFMRNVGCIPLDRGRADIGAVRTALDVLGRGRCLLVFPEGTRSKDGRPGRPRGGVGFLAGKSGAPVVPARVVNTDRLLSLRPLEVRFGEPLRFSGDPADRGQCQAFAELVMGRIFSL